MLPYLYFHWQHPDLALHRAKSLGFSDFLAHSLTWEIDHVAQNYGKALNPWNWFTVAPMMKIAEGQRHIIPGLPQLALGLFPFFFVGLAWMIRGFRRLEVRALFAVLVAAPLSSSFSFFNTLRGMPVGVVFLWISVIGLGWLVSRLNRWPRAELLAHALITVLALAYGGWFFHRVHNIAPAAYQDYRFYGLQSGAPELFSWIEKNHGPYDRVLISRYLFNAGEIYFGFYLSPQSRKKAGFFDDREMCEKPPAKPGEKTLLVTYPEIPKSLPCPARIRPVHVIPDRAGGRLFTLFEYAPLTSDPAVKSGSKPLGLEAPTVSTPLGRTPGSSKGPTVLKFKLPGTRLRRVTVTVETGLECVINVHTVGSGRTAKWDSARVQPREITRTMATLVSPGTPTPVDILEVRVRALKAGATRSIEVKNVSWE
jgi:hypothetical protein